MSDLAIMFDETYDAPLVQRQNRLQAIANYYKITLDSVVEAYFDYIDSNEFYDQRGM